jgi:hypothetical protein
MGRDTVPTLQVGQKRDRVTAQGLNQKEKRAIDAILKAAGVAGEQSSECTQTNENGPIHFLNLFGCEQLATLPPEVEQLSQLTTTFNIFSCNQLTTLPLELGQLSKLTILYILVCERLTTLPPETTLNISCAQGDERRWHQRLDSCQN